MNEELEHAMDVDADIPPDESAIVVLLVDDQAMIGEAVRRALADAADIQFHYCARGSEALDMAVRLSATVILQDLVMPGVDGLTLVSHYRANPATRDIPIIVLSSKEDAAVKSEAFAADVSDYLVKLPDKIELIARIRHHSKSCLNQRQRDAAYRALNESQQKLLEMNEVLQRLSHVDGLTGLSNRRYLDEFLETEWRRAARETSELAVLMIDVDNFKKYNDNYGHLAGDEVLKKVAGAVRQSLNRPADLGAFRRRGIRCRPARHVAVGGAVDRRPYLPQCRGPAGATWRRWRRPAGHHQYRRRGDHASARQDGYRSSCHRR